MKCFESRLLFLFFFALLLVTQNGGKAETIKKSEVDYQNFAFHQWFGTTLVWQFDRLPKDAVVEKHRLPYSGAIYLDHRGGTAAVLQKYDRAFHGGRSRAAAFEWKDIAERGMPHWAGHCNGWVAAAIRHAEPQESVIRNGVVFTPADIKALLAELYVYSDSEFLGGIDPMINPGTLHVVLTNWIGRGQQPIAMETAVGEEVWNYPVFGYASNFRKRDSRHVEVKINVGYVDFIEEEADIAPKRFGRRYFHYMVELNEEGEIVGGSYFDDSDRIDMLWVPLKPARGDKPENEDRNPYIDPDVILGMWREATPIAMRDDWYTVDPAPEDAVANSEWFSVRARPESSLPQPTPEQEAWTRIDLHSFADVEASPGAVVTAMGDGPAAEAVQPSIPQEPPHLSDVETTPVEFGAGDDAPPANDDQAAESEVPALPDDEQAEVPDPGEIGEQATELATEIFRERFPDGTLKMEREVSLDDNFNYVNNGWYRLWNEDGTLIAEGQFENGRRAGAWKRLHWTRDGAHFTRLPFDKFEEPFLSEAEFEAGELNGKWTFKDAKGRLVSAIDFVHGKRHGQHTDWFPDGGTMRVVDFREGKLHGFGRVYEEAGILYAQEEYVAGRRVALEIETYVSTKKRAEKNVLLPPVTMDTPDNWWTGERATFRTEEGKSVQQGPMTAWYENGQVRFQGSFLNGQPVGEFQWWRDNGQISQQGSYCEGKQHGDWHWWHPNGGKAAEGRYDQGRPIGRWMWWNPDGQLADTRVFRIPDASVQRRTPSPGPLEREVTNDSTSTNLREARR